MWLLTTDGFFSVVEDRDDPRQLLVRARALDDLERFLDATNHAAQATGSPNADYPYRVRVDRRAWENYVNAAANQIDYDNFKNRIALADPTRARIYHAVWECLRDIQIVEQTGDRDDSEQIPPAVNS